MQKRVFTQTLWQNGIGGFCIKSMEKNQLGLNLF